MQDVDRAYLVGFLQQLLLLRLKFLLGQKSAFSQIIQLHQVTLERIGRGPWSCVFGDHRRRGAWG